MKELILSYTLMGLNFAGIKFRGWANPRNLKILRGFNFADEGFPNFSRDFYFADQD